MGQWESETPAGMTQQEETIAAMLAEDFYPLGLIATRNNVSMQTLRRMRERSDIQARIAFHRARFRESLNDVVFAERTTRVRVLNQLALILVGQLFETDAKGAQLFIGRGFREVNLVHDSATYGSFLKTLDDIAKELGQRKGQSKDDLLNAFIEAVMSGAPSQDPPRDPGNAEVAG